MFGDTGFLLVTKGLSIRPPQCEPWSTERPWTLVRVYSLDFGCNQVRSKPWCFLQIYEHLRSLQKYIYGPSYLDMGVRQLARFLQRKSKSWCCLLMFTTRVPVEIPRHPAVLGSTRKMETPSFFEVDRNPDVMIGLLKRKHFIQTCVVYIYVQLHVVSFPSIVNYSFVTFDHRHIVCVHLLTRLSSSHLRHSILFIYRW